MATRLHLPAGRAEDLKPAAIHRDNAPPPRTRAEVEAVLRAGEAANTATAPARPLHIALVDGKKDHGIDEHDYPLWQERWSGLLGRAKDVTVSTAHDWPTPEQLDQADVIVMFHFNPAWDPVTRAGDLDHFLARGGGLVLLHSAVMGQKAPEALAERIGLAWQPQSKYRHGPVDLAFARSDNPITAGFDRLHLEDESYWNLAGDPKSVNVLATATEDGQPWPMIWTATRGKGRVFVGLPGHYIWTFDDPLYRVLVLRGICWTAGQPVDRLRDLATAGARLDTTSNPAP
jgi:type 1 glutamine amidotransferase